MLDAFRAHGCPDLRTSIAITPSDAGHPIPDARSVTAAARALAIATQTDAGDLLVVLLSGGASALMACPAEGVSLEAKQETVRTILNAGGDITELNAVRKHLSAIKGGRLAAACRGRVLTLAVSDVVGGDLAVIGSGPTVPDPTTWQSALDVLDRRGGRGAYPGQVVARIERGASGRVPETPKPGDPRLARSAAHIIGEAADAIAGARQAAEAAGYHVRVIAAPVVGDARQAAAVLAREIETIAAGVPRPLCVLSAGETTVRVTGGGRGGRNQELALAFATASARRAHWRFGSADSGPSVQGPHAAGPRVEALFASIGTDGIDGPTDAAGAIVDPTTLARADAMGLAAPEHYLDDNDSYSFFLALDDLVRTGPTTTNVGDIQVMLLGE